MSRKSNKKLFFIFKFQAKSLPVVKLVVIIYMYFFKKAINVTKKNGYF